MCLLDPGAVESNRTCGACRFCLQLSKEAQVGAVEYIHASTDAMPLDVAMLLRNESSYDDDTTGGGGGLVFESSPTIILSSPPLTSSVGDCSPPVNTPFSSLCRRGATFPASSTHHPLSASSLITRCPSDTAMLYRNGAVSCLTLSDFKRELTQLLDDSQQLRLGGGRSHRRLAAGSSVTHKQAAGGAKPKPKRVQFADEQGMQLTTVRVMTEPSDVPPRLQSSAVRELLGQIGADYADDDQGPTSHWLLDFTQPASDYCRFRQTVERQSVALENVVLKNEQCKIVGTIKVKNLAFEKNVFIRFTDNCWQSYFDRPAAYQTPVGIRRVTNADVYDTFSFDIDIPLDDENRDAIEFCVCFRAADAEYWDSNDGNNFRIISEDLRLRREHFEVPQADATTAVRQTHARTPPPPLNDAMLSDCQEWTTFASWKDLSDQGPYY